MLKASFEKNLARIYASRETPRLSGVQIKAPMFLEDNGIVSPSIDKPFTHILKPAGTSGYDALPLVEWAAMTLGRSAGLTAPIAALIPMPDGMPPALSSSASTSARVRTTEGCWPSRISAPCWTLPNAKYDATMEKVARAVRPLSTDSKSDILTVIRRTLFAWLIADGDMHLKNMALLKIAEAGDHSFRSVRMAPLYDAVTTRVFPNLKHDRMALKLNGRDDNLRRPDFQAMARTAGLKAGRCRQSDRCSD